MAFDVSPAPVRRRGPRIPPLVVLAAGIGIVAVALATASPGSGRESSPAARPPSRSPG